jgi:hypothetical protein
MFSFPWNLTAMIDAPSLGYISLLNNAMLRYTMVKATSVNC